MNEQSIDRFLSISTEVANSISRIITLVRLSERSQENITLEQLDEIDILLCSISIILTLEFNRGSKSSKIKFKAYKKGIMETIERYMNNINEIHKEGSFSTEDERTLN